MEAQSLIQASWFYLAENEKCKLNWFLYKFAIKLFDYLKANSNKTVMKFVSQQSDEELAEYCAYFAKRMRNNTQRHHYRDIGADIADDEYNRDYCHYNTQAENEILAKVAEAAWLDLLVYCSFCPSGCLNEGSISCNYFDDMGNGENC